MNALLLLALSASQPAHAWNHTYTAWDREDFPITYYNADYVEDSIDEAYQYEAIDKAWNNWIIDAPCARLEAEPGGILEDYHLGFQDDGRTVFDFDDPLDQLGVGPLAATLTRTNGEVLFTLGGGTYYRASGSDIVYNTDIDWGETGDIDAGICNNEYALESVTTHEIGHLWGMGHSCEEGEDCPVQDERYAVMYWSTGPCDTYQGELKDDDIEGINALYGPYCSFEVAADSDPFGGVPHEVCFELSCNEETTGISWQFGDGATSTDQSPCHTYEEKGQYTVALTITGEGEDCGEWEYTQREQALVLTCGIPEPTDGFTGLFTYEPVDGLIYQMVNQTDTSVYGCIDRISWQVYKGSEMVQEISAWSPKIAFPSEGDYRVVLNVGGPGGISAGELNIEVTEVKSGGCSVVPATASLFGLLVGIGAAVRRRRS